MITLNEFLCGAVLPGLIAAATLAAVWNRTHNAGSSWRTAALLGFVAGLWALDALAVGVTPALAKSWQITEARDWLPLLVFLGCFPDALASFGKRAELAAWLLRLLLAVFLPWRLLAGSVFLPDPAAAPNPFNKSAWSTAEATAWLAAIAVALVAVWGSWIAARDHAPRWRTALVALVILAAAITLALSGTLTSGQLLGVLLATLVGSGLAAAAGKLQRGPDAAAGPLLMAFGGILVIAHFFAGLKLTSAVLLLVALAVAGGWFFPNQKGSLPLRAAICLLVVGWVIAVAGMDFAAAGG